MMIFEEKGIILQWTYSISHSFDTSESRSISDSNTQILLHHNKKLENVQTWTEQLINQ